jgi:hypothetical protein
MARIPTVGAKQLHPVQLSKGIRRRRYRQAKNAARRESAPILRADQAAFGSANRAYGMEASSVKNATSMVEQQLAAALQGLGASGLSGKYKRQAAQEFTARQADAASAIPFLLANAAQDRTKSIEEARNQLMGDRAQMQSTAASKFNQLLKEDRSAGTSAIEAAQKKRESSKEGSREEAKVANKEVNLAVQEVRRLLQAYPEEHPETKEEWSAFVGQVAKAEGVGLRAAMDGVRQYQQEQRERQLLKNYPHR